MRNSILSLFVALALTACSSHAFPTKAPSSDVLDTNYKAWQHRLADNPAYHFSVLIPNEWKILQTTVARKPEGDKPLEIALFREPGAWIEDENQPPEGEIVFEVFTTSGSALGSGSMDQAPTAWLKRKLKDGLGDYKLLKQRTFKSLYGQAADVLVQSGAGKEIVISRLAAFRAPSNPEEIFVIVGSATAEGYERSAEAFATAIITFKLDAVKGAKTGTGALNNRN